MKTVAGAVAQFPELLVLPSWLLSEGARIKLVSALHAVTSGPTNEPLIEESLSDVVVGLCKLV